MGLLSFLSKKKKKQSQRREIKRNYIFNSVEGENHIHQRGDETTELRTLKVVFSAKEVERDLRGKERELSGRRSPIIQERELSRREKF